jgi:hypothetical protein
MNSRVVSFANSAIAIQWIGETAACLVNFLFGAVPENKAVDPHLTFQISPGEAKDELHLSTGDPTEECRGLPGQITLQLMERVTYHLADRSQGGVLFHAAGLCKEGNAIVFPGSSGSGKSSLALWLAAQGYRYLSDELVFVPSGGLECQGLRRPVHLKPPAHILFTNQLKNKAMALGDSNTGPTGWLLPPHLISEPSPETSCQIQCLIFPHYHPRATFEFERLTRASAAVALTGVLVNARNLPDNGFPELLRLARAIPTYQLTYSSFEQIGETLNFSA